MKLSDLKSIDQIVEERRETDLEFAAEWDRATFAREVAAAVIRYRADRGITQQILADETGLKQSAVGRLELGEQAPSLQTLAKLTKATGLRFRLDIARGDVAVPVVAPPETAGVFRFAISFSVLFQSGDGLTADELRDQGEQLMEALLDLERCNPGMRDPGTSVDAVDGSVTVELTMTGGDDAAAVRAAMDICRAAIHAIGGGTPAWPSALDSGRGADFRPKAMQFDYA
jgi:transcriptional regulator with XRE-family HTH domain